MRYFSTEQKYESVHTRDETIYDDLRHRPKHEDDTDPAIPRQIVKYMNTEFKEVNAGKFKLITAFVDMFRVQCSKTVNNLLKAARLVWQTKLRNVVKIDVEVDSSSYRMSCNPALGTRRNTDCLSTIFEFQGLANQLFHFGLGKVQAILENIATMAGS